MIVFDASLALKWYLDEPGSQAAESALAQHGGQIIVPDVFVLEVTGALVRQANMSKAIRGDMETALSGFLALIDEQVISMDETGTAAMVRAAGLALDLGHPLKDCIYLALAMKMGCELLTSDRRFAAKAVAAWPKVRVLEG
ncbi:MAG: type II toxin-antitoxin system VapC family toxin [Novosphingobium sp.]|uniref:type II toxin-antitoxin system VapC family toxin n=1 Tax=Novosphingobium sp. TaxID=1874826 RepID=UPI00301A000B